LNQDQKTDERNSERQTEEPITEEPVELLHPEPTPLFLEDSPADQQGDAQDEKDKTEE